MQLMLYQGVIWLCSTTRCQMPAKTQLPSPRNWYGCCWFNNQIGPPKTGGSCSVLLCKGSRPIHTAHLQRGKDRYLKFCSQADKNPLPVTEQVLCSFVSHLAQQGLKHRSIKVYLSAICHLQIEGNYLDPFGGAAMPKLEYVLRGVRKHELEKGAGQRPCLPITPDIFHRIRAQWESTGHTWDTRMFWAACCLCFFAFLRVSEMSVPDDTSYDPDVHLSFRDIAIDDLKNPTVLRVTIK